MANNLVTRVSVDTLSDAALALLRQGYAAMEAISDNRGFNSIAGIHGIPGHFCHRDPILFLPWHRAYLYSFEQFLQDQAAGASIPWWDWTSDTSHNVGLPAAFTDANDPAGNPNPLVGSHISVPQEGVDEDTTRNPQDPASLPSMDVPIPGIGSVNDVLGLTDFADFSGQLEQIHNMVHGWVGGSMGVIATAAFDPVFYSHHSMIDRLWYIWQVQNGANNIPQNLLSRTLPPFNMTLNDVLDISRLGYQYAVGHVTG
jgi:tyrosinase